MKKAMQIIGALIGLVFMYMFGVIGGYLTGYEDREDGKENVFKKDNWISKKKGE